MIILITGHCGFIGSHLANSIKNFYGIDLKENGDIRSSILPKDVTHIYHLAAKRSVPKGEIESEEFISTNVWGTCRLLKLFPNAKILNISSSSAEECRSIYGITKKAGELLAKNHKNCLNVRLYNVFGEGQTLESGAVVPHFIKAKLEGKKPIIYGDGEQRRDFTYVGDVVNHLIYLMNEAHWPDEVDGNGIAHAGYGHSISVNSLCKMIYGKMPEAEYQFSRPYDILFSRSKMRIKKIFGRQEGIKRTINWWKQKENI